MLAGLLLNQPIPGRGPRERIHIPLEKEVEELIAVHEMNTPSFRDIPKIRRKKTSPAEETLILWLLEDD